MQVKQNQIILTDRLILRHFNENDLEALYALLQDEEVNVFLPWFPVNNMEEAFNFLKERFLNEYDKGIFFRYAICLKEDNLPIGYVWVSNDESHDFGYALMKEHWHKGIAYEASLAVIEQLKTSGYTYITATHDIHNQRSGEVMKKLGMKYKYSYLEQWQPKNIPVTFRMYQLNLDGHNRTYMKYWNQYKHFIEEL
ncbi:MAG: GNAT family N-acetyltransferase [Bacilli bacterium]|nr:GNAT family N-acetyltransferase [Bacilli bacterium]